ncbi:MAG: hypothetical protein WC205_10970 [Opitutaceae bacterium]|jgi:hypothetical protein
MLDFYVFEFSQALPAVPDCFPFNGESVLCGRFAPRLNLTTTQKAFRMRHTLLIRWFHSRSQRTPFHDVPADRSTPQNRIRPNLLIRAMLNQTFICPKPTITLSESG